jgi:hypothetical protein
MKFARLSLATAGCVALAASAAACSGSFGSGSTMPSTMASPSFGNPTPSPTPSAVSNILTIGTSSGFQALPEIGGYSGQIAFPLVDPDVQTPPPKGTPYPSPTPVSISIGATLSVVKPSDGPDLNLESGKGAHAHTRDRPARALAYIELLPTHDVTLASYPRITLDIPREIAAQYRDGEFGLALWNSGEKDSAYHLEVAEIDAISTPPPMAAHPTATAIATSTANASASPSVSPTPLTPAGQLPPRSNLPPGMSGNVPVVGPVGSFAPGAPTPTPAATLPPQRILFGGTAKPLKLIANRPAIFALYALPHPHATPAPVGSGAPTGSAAPSSGSAAPASTSATAPATTAATKGP